MEIKEIKDLNIQQMAVMCESYFTLASPEEVYKHLTKETKFEEPMKEDENKNVYGHNTNINQPTNFI